MQKRNLTQSDKGFIPKVLFFVVLLTSVAFLYIESKNILDLTYLIVVFILFIRFLVIKLYQ